VREVARSLRETAPLDENIVFGFSGRAEVDLACAPLFNRALEHPAVFTVNDFRSGRPLSGLSALEAGRHSSGWNLTLGALVWFGVQAVEH
jgi:hypothetical protein